MRAFLSLLLAAAASAQGTSPVVNPDHTVTFRYANPAAGKVALAVEGTKAPIPMAADKPGQWFYTTAAMAPEYYYYHFDVDGRSTLDPHNFGIVFATNAVANSFLVPGTPARPWETAAIPHGEVSRHTYTSKIVQGYPANQSEYYVYTPAGFDPHAATKYPVLYLLHGWSHRAGDWTGIGHAANILDSLIANGKAKPMIVVMPTGYGDLSFLSSFQVWQDPAAIAHNDSLFEQALLSEVIPAVEREYPVSARQPDRAIAGLSMGGLEALSTGLTHQDTFGYVGGFSSAVHQLAPAPLPPAMAKNSGVKLVWIACGTEDDLINANRRLAATLKADGLPVTEVETPGLHTWTVWREDLVSFVPLLFR